MKRRVTRAPRPAAAPPSGTAPREAVSAESPPPAVSALVVIGASQGGVQAVTELLRHLPADFTTPIAVTLHRERSSDSFLASALGRGVAFTVLEATDKAPLAPRHVFVAPADYHLLIERGHCALSTEPPVRFSRPSIDLLFESAADAYGPALTAIVLTGANDDGARGAVAVVQRHGCVLVQSPDTADTPVMPRAALAAVPAARSGSVVTLAAWLAPQPANPAPSQ